MYKTLIGIVIAATLVYSGIKQITTGKMDGAKKDYAKYTAESMEKASKITGFLYFPLAILLVVQDLIWDNIIVSPIQPDFIYIIIAGIILLLLVIVYNVIVKKKDIATDNGNDELADND